MIKHTIYKTTNKLNDKFYIGKHSTNNIHDAYLGSGVALKKAIKKYGIENFEKEILFCFENEQEAFLKEFEIVNAELISNPLCYNLTLGGRGSFFNINKKPMSDETKRKISFSSTGRKKSLETIEKIRQKILGRKHSEEAKQKMRGPFSEEHKANISKSHADVSGEKNPFFGKTHSEETKQKLRNADYTSRRRPNPKHGKCKGKKWFHHKDGKNYMLFENDPKIKELNLSLGRINYKRN